MRGDGTEQTNKYQRFKSRKYKSLYSIQAATNDYIVNKIFTTEKKIQRNFISHSHQTISSFSSALFYVFAFLFCFIFGLLNESNHPRVRCIDWSYVCSRDFFVRFCSNHWLKVSTKSAVKVFQKKEIIAIQICYFVKSDGETDVDWDKKMKEYASEEAIISKREKEICICISMPPRSLLPIHISNARNVILSCV